MLLMFERGIRGGITQVVHHYALANNRCMGDHYDPSSETSYLQYLDANNLYGWAMSQPLPIGRFGWVEVKPNKISDLVRCSDKGYLLEVDVSYLRDLHNSHNDVPFMCERMEINGVEKLVPNLRDRKIMLFTFKLWIKHSLMDWYLRGFIERSNLINLCYIDFNTRLRAAAKSDFEKDFFKLMNNAVFRDNDGEH